MYALQIGSLKRAQYPQMNYDLRAYELKDFLSELIKIPSVNPDGDPGTALENTGEKKIAIALGEVLQNIGAEVQYDEVERDRPNIIAKFPGSENKPQILLAPHLDTVGVGGMSIDPFGGTQEGGKIYGRGASDTKGTAAAMIWALYRMGLQKIKNLNIGVTFVGFMGEETGQPGSRHFARRYKGQYDFALVGEPTGNNIVCRHKGTLWLILEVLGKSAHGATPEKGKNAISKMSELVILLETQFKKDLSAKAFHNEYLGYPTINIGMITGGTRTNIVPEHCKIEIDLRLTPELKTTEAIKKIKSFLKQNGFTDTKISTKLSCEPLNTEETNPYVETLKSLPNSPKVIGAPWFCDAAVLSSEGDIPAVAGGPGHIDQAHTADEWIKEKDLESGADFYQNFLISAGL